MYYTVTIEAGAYGEPEDDAETLLKLLPGDDEPEDDTDPVPDLITTVGFDGDAQMLRAGFRFEADDALDAHSQAMDIWQEGWQEAFPGLAPPAEFAIRAKPVEVPA